MQPPGGDPQIMGNPHPSDDPQPSTSSEDVEMDIEDTDGDHPYTLASPASTPVILPVMNSPNVDQSEADFQWQASPNEAHGAVISTN